MPRDDDERMTRWWEGLSEPEREDALTFQQTGQLTDKLQQSLTSAELLEPKQDRTDREVSPRVRDFLKMRHD